MKIYINGYPASRENLEICLSEQADNIVDYCVSKNGNIILQYNDEPKNGGKHERIRHN